jgi:hypothetical protein
VFWISVCLRGRKGDDVYARVAAFEGGDTDRIRQVNEQRRQQEGWMPKGVRRVLVLNDEQGSKRLFVTMFDSREALQSAEQQFEQMGNEIPEEIRGRRTSLDVYEVVVDEAV